MDSFPLSRGSHTGQGGGKRHPLAVVAPDRGWRTEVGAPAESPPSSPPGSPASLGAAVAGCTAVTARQKQKPGGLPSEKVQKAAFPTGPASGAQGQGHG